MQYIKGLILILILVEIFMSSFIIYTSNKTTDFCLTGENCKLVQNSEYSYFLGIKLSYLGLLSSLILIITFYLTEKNKIKSRYFIALTIIGSLFALYFIYLQFFIIKAICSNCLIFDIGMLIIATLSLYSYNK